MTPATERMAHKWQGEAQPATVEAVARRAVKTNRVLGSLNIQLDITRGGLNNRTSSPQYWLASLKDLCD